ncbi:MAG: ABC transporter ATP-binding protein [Planctomycetia bacterium]|nr:ABC transporter ATP-binding protein [Planctomycetia bacterium]
MEKDTENNQMDNTGKTAVKTSGLVRTFTQGKNRITALSGVDLTIKKGEFIAVMGASGSGKSTLLHLIAGLILPSSGAVEVEGEDLSRMSDRKLTIFRRRKIGLVFQNFNLIPHLTAEENILLPICADGGKIKNSEEKRRILWKQLEIEDQLGQYPDTLSGGQQQRIALARALSMDPAILLADEPTGNLDSVSSQNICRILNDLNRNEGRTIALVSHEPSVAIWARRIIILSDGGILADLQTDAFRDAHELASKYQEIVSSAKSSENE